jgi:2-polyprenyl-6-hydroxyphenyl methylase/3-demethylubiquinone-9 3-methyltransferase
MNTDSYYSERLAAEKLKRCYEIATPRVRQYLEAEIEHVLSRITKNDIVLELGCGFGRVLKRLCPAVLVAVGIDIAGPSLELAEKLLSDEQNYRLCLMNASDLEFPDGFFDAVICVQNGISAFHLDMGELIKEAVRVTGKGGRVLFSSYSDKFWKERLEWFYLQSEEGLVGEIDSAKTGNGVIVCRDGFRATTVGPDEFGRLVSELGFEAVVTEVDDSSVFLEIVV